MATKRLTLNFPPHLIDQPVTYQLITEHNLKVNILRARLGLDIKPLAQDVSWHEDKCIECTACSSVCPTGALSVERKEMRVTFEQEKCIACELCIPACPYEAMQITF
jgi:Fe-S-cluster-containing hydrogenase component 2